MKTKTTSTPGPWTVRNGHGAPQIVGPDWRSTAGMGPICRMDRDYSPSVEAANARLIASAPELLRALKLVKGVEESEAWAIEEVTDLYNDGYAETESAVVKKIVRAVIAKAEER